MAIDRTVELVNLRECLKLLRDKKTERAVEIMETSLDGAVISLSRHLDQCDSGTKNAIGFELRKVWLYRKDAPGYVSSCLDGADPDTRGRLVRMRDEAETILTKHAP